MQSNDYVEGIICKFSVMGVGLKQGGHPFHAQKLGWNDSFWPMFAYFH